MRGRTCPRANPSLDFWLRRPPRGSGGKHSQSAPTSNTQSPMRNCVRGSTRRVRPSSPGFLSDEKTAAVESATKRLTVCSKIRTPFAFPTRRIYIIHRVITNTLIRAKELTSWIYRQPSSNSTVIHSKIESIGWRWVCSKCGEAAAILLAPVGRDFVCTECRRGGGDYVLPGNFVALPQEGHR